MKYHQSFAAFIITLLFPLFAIGQHGEDITVHITNINKYYGISQSISPFEDEGGLIEIYNDSIAIELKGLLQSKQLTPKKYNSIFSKLSIYKTSSADGKFWIFNWYANSGGSYQVYYEVLFAQLSNHKVYVSEVTDGVGTDTVHTFTSGKSKTYLAESSGRTCSSCENAVARAYSINDTALVERADFFDSTSAIILLDARTGDILEFGYNATTKKFRVKYITDDLTGTDDNENLGDTVEYEYIYNKGYLQFNKQ